MVTSSGLGCINEDLRLKKILPNLNIKNVSEEYEGRIDIFPECTEDQRNEALSWTGKRVWGTKKEKSQQWPHMRDIQVIMS